MLYTYNIYNVVILNTYQTWSNGSTYSVMQLSKEKNVVCVREE